MSEITMNHEIDLVLESPELTDQQIVEVWTNVAPQHPALSRVHDKLANSSAVQAAITSYDRMHHRHNR